VIRTRGMSAALDMPIDIVYWRVDASAPSRHQRGVPIGLCSCVRNSGLGSNAKGLRHAMRHAFPCAMQFATRNSNHVCIGTTKEEVILHRG